MRPYTVQTMESMQARCIEVGECWIWQGGNDGHGKPVCKHRGKVVNPRRIVRELTDKKPLGPGVQVVPACHNPKCISPACSIRTDPKGRARIANERGAFNNPSKIRRSAMTKRAKSWITEDVVSKVRSARTAVEASELTGVSLSHSKAIRRGEARRDYGSPFAGLGA